MTHFYLPGPPKHPGSREWIFEGAAESPGLLPALTSPHRQVELFLHIYIYSSSNSLILRRRGAHTCISVAAPCLICPVSLNMNTVFMYSRWWVCPLRSGSAVLTSVTFRETWRRSPPSSRCWSSPWRSTQSQSEKPIKWRCHMSISGSKVASLVMRSCQLTLTSNSSYITECRHWHLVVDWRNNLWQLITVSNVSFVRADSQRASRGSAASSWVWCPR